MLVVNRALFVYVWWHFGSARNGIPPEISTRAGLVRTSLVSNKPDFDVRVEPSLYEPCVRIV